MYVEMMVLDATLREALQLSGKRVTAPISQNAAQEQNCAGFYFRLHLNRGLCEFVVIYWLVHDVRGEVL